MLVDLRNDFINSSVVTNKMMLGHGSKINLNLFRRSVAFQDFCRIARCFFHGTRCNFFQTYGMGQVAYHEHESVALCPPSLKVCSLINER